jgi:hypothetical protein
MQLLNREVGRDRNSLIAEASIWSTDNGPGRQFGSRVQAVHLWNSRRGQDPMDELVTSAELCASDCFGMYLPVLGEAEKICNRRIFSVAERRGQSRLTEPLADAQFQQGERVFVPLNRPSRWNGAAAQLGGI